MNRVERLAVARRCATREHAVVHRVAALLLDYPSADVVALLPTVRAALEEVRPELAAPLRRAVEHLEATPVDRLERDYVTTFDLQRRCSLFLTYFAYGDTRKRGVALVEFKQAYRRAGFEVAEAELPDHLAVVLEFAATAPDDEARATGIALLLAHRAGLELLRLALLDAGSPWADVVASVSATLPPLAGEDREAVARLAAEGPPDEDVGLEPFATTPEMPLTGARR